MRTCSRRNIQSCALARALLLFFFLLFLDEAHSGLPLAHGGCVNNTPANLSHLSSCSTSPTLIGNQTWLEKVRSHQRECNYKIAGSVAPAHRAPGMDSSAFANILHQMACNVAVLVQTTCALIASMAPIIESEISPSWAARRAVRHRFGWREPRVRRQQRRNSGSVCIIRYESHLLLRRHFALGICTNYMYVIFFVSRTIFERMQ